MSRCSGVIRFLACPKARCDAQALSVEYIYTQHMDDQPVVGAANFSSTDGEEGTGFLIHRWEIWYVYACYLSRDIGDLPKAAERLLKSHFGEAIILPSGQVGWRKAEGVEWGMMQEEDSIGAVRTALQFPPELPAELREPVFHAATMRSAARNVFSLLAPASDDFMVIALPQLVVYLSEEQEIPLEVTIRLMRAASHSWRSAPVSCRPRAYR